MNESSRPRRSLLVVLLDAMLAVVTAVQTGNMPGTRRGGDGRPARRAGIAWLALGLLVAAAGTAILVTALLRAPDGLADLPPAGQAAPAPAASVAPTSPARPAPSGSSRATSATATTATAPPSARDGLITALPSSAATSVGGARLTADYVAAAGTGLLGYRATVTIKGQGPDVANGWQLTITLPRTTLQIASVDGATVEQDGAVWTFAPVDETRKIAPGDSVVISFDVRGATLVDAEPSDCRINGAPCAGLGR